MDPHSISCHPDPVLYSKAGLSACGLLLWWPQSQHPWYQCSFILPWTVSESTWGNWWLNVMAICSVKETLTQSDSSTTCCAWHQLRVLTAHNWHHPHDKGHNYRPWSQQGACIVSGVPKEQCGTPVKCFGNSAGSPPGGILPVIWHHPQELEWGWL